MAPMTINLSARGSRNFPKSVTSPRLRAILPSRRSVYAAMQNSASPVISAHRASEAIMTATKIGTRIRRRTVSRFGRFIFICISPF